MNELEIIEYEKQESHLLKLELNKLLNELNNYNKSQPSDDLQKIQQINEKYNSFEYTCGCEECKPQEIPYTNPLNNPLYVNKDEQYEEFIKLLNHKDYSDFEVEYNNKLREIDLLYKKYNEKIANDLSVRRLEEFKKQLINKLSSNPEPNYKLMLKDLINYNLVISDFAEILKQFI